MAEILQIEGDKVKIGTDDGKVVTVPLKNLNYEEPQKGDKVKFYKDGGEYIVTREGSSMEGLIGTDAKGNKKINKHIFVWIGSFMFGGFGVDRFLRGQIGTGVCKLLFNWLTLGIWSLVDWIIALTKAYGSAYGNTENITFDADGKYTR